MAEKSQKPLPWKVPLADISFDEEEIEAVDNVLRSRWLSMGEVTQRFEQKMGSYLGVKHAFAVSNGTAALHLACASLGLDRGDEVILPALTFVATANAVVYTGATPVFAEISSLDDLTLSPEQVEKQITPRTKAIVVMHYGGYPCDMASILEIARGHNLAVIEDAAHAPGTILNGTKAGAFGEAGCFSFFANKNIVTGEGGMVVTNRDDLAERIRLMRSHGMTNLTWDRHQGHAHTYDVVALGYNYRLDEIRAALGLVQLKKLEENNHKRRLVSQAYRQAFSGIAGLKIPFLSARGTPSYHLFPILLEAGIDRTLFINHMRQAGIQTSIHYPPIHLFNYYRERYGYREELLPLTEQAGAQEVTLPLYSGLSDEQIELVIRSVRVCLQ